jgi:hypothetical protein
VGKRVRDLDEEMAVIPASTVRGCCFGHLENGSPAGSNSTWAKYRKEVGIVTLSRNITRYHAVLLMLRSRLSKICQDMGCPFPKEITNTTLEDIADMAMEHYKFNIMAFVNMLALPQSNPSGKEIWEAVQLHSEKPISLSTMRRRCDRPGCPKFRIGQIYTNRQATMMIKFALMEP